MLPTGRRHSRRERRGRADLDGEPAPYWPDATKRQTAYNAATTRHLHATRGPQTANRDQMLDAVVLGQAVTFLPASYADSAAHPGLAYVPVSGISLSTVEVAWTYTSRSQAVAAFVRPAQDIAARTENTDPESQTDAVLNAAPEFDRDFVSRQPGGVRESARQRGHTLA